MTAIPLPSLLLRRRGMKVKHDYYFGAPCYIVTLDFEFIFKEDFLMAKRFASRVSGLAITAAAALSPATAADIKTRVCTQ